MLKSKKIQNSKKNITKTEKRRKKVAEMLTLFPKFSRIYRKLVI